MQRPKNPKGQVLIKALCWRPQGHCTATMKPNMANKVGAELIYFNFKPIGTLSYITPKLRRPNAFSVFKYRKMLCTFIWAILFNWVGKYTTHLRKWQIDVMKISLSRVVGRLQLDPTKKVYLVHRITRWRLVKKRLQFWLLFSKANKMKIDVN